MTMIKACGYARVSTLKGADQGEVSIEAQIDFIKEWAKKDEVELVKIYIDKESAKDTNRDSFQEMLNDGRSGKWTRAYFYNNDRWSRDKADASVLKKELVDKLGLELKFGNLGNMDISTPSGGLVFGIMSDFAEYYSKDLGDKTKRGMGQRKIQGYHIGRLSMYFEKIKNFDEKGNKVSISPDNVRIKPEYEDLVSEVIKLSRKRKKLSKSKIARITGVCDHKVVQTIIRTYHWMNGGTDGL